MTVHQKMLLETLAGHFAWLEAAHPRKAKAAKAQAAKRAVTTRLRACQKSQFRLAA